MRILRSLMLCMVFGSPGASGAVDVDRLTDTVQRGMADWGIPGIAVAVLDDGELVMARGFGVTAVERGAPVDEHTLFANASTTKAMLAAGILILVDEGRVDLDALAIDYLPQLHFGDPTLTQQITVRDLLTHRTGLPSMDFWTFNQGLALDDQIPLLREVEPVASPRSKHIYQNTMYELAGLIIEEVSGLPWEDFLRARLWDPIGMDATYGTIADIDPRHRRALPHDEVNGVMRRIDFSLLPDVADAAGSVWSSVTDMMRWARFLLDDGVTASGRRLLSSAAISEMFTPQKLIASDDYYVSEELTEPHWRSYGLGWYQQDFQGRKIDFHTGSLNGMVAILGLDQAQGRAVMVMANREGAELRHALLWEVMDDSTAERRDWHADILALYDARQAERDARWASIEAGRIADAPPSLPLAAYAGAYHSAKNGPIEITANGDDLRLDTLVRSYRLTPWHADSFLVMHEDWSRGDFAHFELSPAGTIDAVEFFGEPFARVAD